MEASLLTTSIQFRGTVLLFIDGLDERTDHEDLLDLVHPFSTVSKVKTCVSSRPEPVFVDRLHDLPNLKLHELISRDIERFIKRTLLGDLRIMAMEHRASSHSEESGIEELVRGIERKSEGVLLWVHLVVKDLLKGISNKDDVAVLFHRLDRLPGDILVL